MPGLNTSASVIRQPTIDSPNVSFVDGTQRYTLCWHKRARAQCIAHGGDSAVSSTTPFAYEITAHIRYISVSP